MGDSIDLQDKADASIDASLILRAVLKSLMRIGLVTVLLCAAAYAILLFVPKTFESRAELLIGPRGNPAATSPATGSEAYLIDAAAVASQIELIKSRDTIRAAIDALELRADPAFEGRSDEQIIAEISDDLVVTQERSSRLVSVAYRSQDPDLAARLANGIAVAHVNRRAGQQTSDTVETTGWLQEEIERLRQSVADAERAIARFRVENDLFVGANNESLTNQQLSNFSSQITAAAERRSAAQSRAQLIRALLESGQSVIGVSDVQASSVGQELSQELGRLQGERAQRSATLLPNHPTIRALDAQISEIEGQIAAEGRRIASALESQAQIEADLQASLESELDRLKVTAGDDTLEGVTLASLEREATAQRELLNAYLLRFAEATARSDVSSALPDVRIVSEAAPPVKPASPQTTMIMLAVAIASILLQVGAVIFSELLSGRALVEREPNGVRVAADEQVSVEGWQTPSTEADAEPIPAQAISTRTDPSVLVRVDNESESQPNQRPRYQVHSSIEVEIEAIAASAIAGKERVLVIATGAGGMDGGKFSEFLSARLVNDGLSVAEIDAASGQQGVELGLTDLCAQEAEFGDVVHRASDGRFAFVPWGHGSRLTPNSGRPATLVQALSDIYECVIVVAGRVGAGSTLPLFSGTGAHCLILCGDGSLGSREMEEIEVLGYPAVRAITLHDAQSEVA